MTNWDELMDATSQATGGKPSKTINESGGNPLNPDEQAFRMFETRLNNIGIALNELFGEMKTYKQKKGLR